MAHLDFPSSPTVGQLYPSPPVAGAPVYRWDGEKWAINAVFSVYTPEAPNDQWTYGRHALGWAATMPAGLAIGSAVDLNTITAIGVYYCNTSNNSNGPTAVGGQWYVEVLPYAGAGSGYLLQRATSLLPDATQYMRVLFNNVWQPWIGTGGSTVVGQIEMWPTSDVPPARLKCNGAAYARATYPALFGAITKSGNAAFTNGSPNVLMPAHGRSPFDMVKLFTTGALPTGFNAATHGLVTVGAVYAVKTVVDANTITLTGTPGGTAITAGSAGSGTHTWVYAPHGDGDGASTFTVPEMRGEFPRFWDDSRGVDALRALGIDQLDQFQGHYHDTSNPKTTPSVYDENGGAAGPNVARLSTARSILGAITDGISGTPRAGSETRPRNMPLMATIRYAA